ncbi:MAG: Transcriptional regulator, TetR family [Candidatus Sulfotelmatobacter sp.]|jgi:AcrR family transcriptional regulator|nr:Transcriptional regulator, TetR family [Candidatus Sulfotelmatobacter sp.]
MTSKIQGPILEIAIELFANHGYAGVGIREIAAAANVTPGSIFRLFESKDSLFQEALKTVAYRSLAPGEFQKLLQADEEEFSLLAQRAIRRWYSSLSPQSARLLMYAALSDNEQWREMASTRTGEIAGILAQSIRKEARKSKVRNVDALAASRTLILALFSLRSTHSLLSTGEKEREAVSKMILQWVHGLALA